MKIKYDTNLFNSLVIKNKTFKKVAMLLLVFFGFNNIYSQTITYTSGSGNFVVPCDVTSITVEIWGGGGAGGAADNNPNGGSGGGAGGYSSATLTVTAGSSIAYSVGTGGTGGVNDGGNGTVTTFGGLTANGGNGGGQNQGAIGTGGTASGGSSNITGNSGGQGTTTLGAAGGNANGTGGGTGGVARTGATNNGNNGNTPGGGGGGALRISAGGRTGGNGARGEIRITYTTSLFTYCVPTFTGGMEPITNVTFAGINNTTTNVTGGTIYLENFCNTATVQQGQTVPISVKGNTAGNFTNFFRLYVDWNKNGTFGDVANEIYDLGTITNSTGVDAIVLNSNITVPATASLGLTKMRIMKRFSGYSTGPCQTGAGFGQAEDYNVNVTSPPPCTTPTAQPTALTFNTLTSTSLNGSFTAASPAPSGYLIVRSTSATAPILVNGTTYTVGSTALGAGTLVIQGSAVTSNTTSFTSGTLTSNTRYYYHIFSYNTSCTGAPFYNTTTPLSNSVITCPMAPTAPVNSAITGSGFTVTWTASAAGGNAALIEYILEVSTDAGFTSPIVGSPFSVGTAVTYSITGLNAGTTYYYRIKANNESCDSSYLNGNGTTLLSNDICSQAIALTVNPSLACATSTIGSTIGATDNNETGDCTNNGTEKAVWYNFTATGTSHIITVDGIAGFNAVVRVITTCGTATTPTGGACTNATSDDGIETLTLTGLTVGATYYVQVYDFNGDNTGSAFTICVTTPVPPSNNQCANATNLPCAISNLAGTTVLANSYTNGSGCAMSDYGGWYTFVGDGNSSTISVTTTNYDIVLSISSGSCGSLINIACQDSALSNGTETYTFTTTVGVTYYVYIAHWLTGSSTTGTFTISRSCSVPFNPCTSISNIATCGSANSVTIPAGAGGYSPSSCGWTTPGVERIYTFTPASTGNFTITQTSSFGFIDYQIKPVSLGCSSSGWTCIDDLSGAGTSPSFTLTAGIQYYILLDPEVSTGGNVNFTINCPTPPLTNDEPCNAIALTVTTTCNYSTYTNSGAAASVGIPAPGCALYSGGDVWFSVVVPVSGQITVDLQSGGITDSGMAFYSGTCGALTLLECDDDDSNNGAMSNISMTGLTPGQTIYIRVWEFGNDTNGTFGICATTPSCPSPSDLLANILSTTSVTINWNASAPPASGGYQYFINTTGVAPTATTAPTGSTAPGVIGVTLTGLTPGLKYYFWVRSFCGGSDSSAWFGPTNYSPCAVGNGTGTTTLDCPAVLSGGLGLNGGDPPTMSCQALGCVDLEATYLQINQPTNYSVSSIPYAPPYQFTCLQNPVSVNVDDIWSPMINLPFNFCFYGNNYNRCLIGSNGVITFDTTTYAPGGYNNWSFSNDLPNASLFRNTIFGVYHDIDPSIGGQVGWELITLNTGCRALVAAWNDIPMFSSTCNSQLYTGMIVLYENTNVIEVYVKEKNTCGTWNSGNAIVGIQNGAGTAAVVAPNRNGQSADWTVTNEAWRFTPTGTTLTTLKWFEGNGTSGTQIGTTNSINVCPTVTTTYTAEVTYALCNGTNLRYTDNVVVNINGNKIWNGTQGPNWNVNNNWTPSGVPTSANCVVIPTTANNPVLSSTPNGVGYNLSVYNGAQLTVNSNQNLTITDKVTVQPTGIFTFNNSASLIQINNVLNSGNIIYKRDSPNIRTLDYVYWSSPVAGFNVSNIVLPYSFGGIFKWNTTLANTNGGQGGWQSAAGNIMTAGKGYIARAPGTAPFNNTTFNVLSGTFTGVPNNGNISFPIERGNDQNLAPHFGTNGIQLTNLSDNWNLIGNPYPSAIRASQFLFDNSTKIEGNVRLWTHGTLPSVIIPNPFYGSYLSNYTPGDYLTYNFTGTSCCPTAASDLFIGAGQGFFVQMVDGPSVAAVDNITVNFNNNLRNAAFSNSTFYKNQNATTSSVIDVESIERNRIWLDFITPNNQTDRILFGYIENATMGIDSFYDCMTQIGTTPSLYTLTDVTKFSIQGRALPFDVNDEVPLGFNATTAGNHTIGITAVDGLFNNQTIYLKDTLLNIIHNIKEAPYTFTTQIGEINNRFKIVYVDGALGTPTNSLDNTIKVMTNNEVAVSSSNLEMASISVYTLLGQKLDTYDSINSNFIILSNLRKNNTTLLLKIKLETGETITKKIIY